MTIIASILEVSWTKCIPYQTNPLCESLSLSLWVTSIKRAASGYYAEVAEMCYPAQYTWLHYVHFENCYKCLAWQLLVLQTCVSNFTSIRKVTTRLSVIVTSLEESVYRDIQGACVIGFHGPALLQLITLASEVIYTAWTKRLDPVLKNFESLIGLSVFFFVFFCFGFTFNLVSGWQYIYACALPHLPCTKKTAVGKRVIPQVIFKKKFNL